RPAPVPFDECVMGLCVRGALSAVDVMLAAHSLLARAEAPTSTVRVTLGPIEEPAAAAIEREILRRAAGLRRVYERALLADSSLRGSVALSFRVEPSGTLSHVRVTRRGTGLDDVGRDAVRVVAPIRIRPVSAEPVELTIALDFER